jgi:hypothetical protein
MVNFHENFVVATLKVEEFIFKIIIYFEHIMFPW